MRMFASLTQLLRPRVLTSVRPALFILLLLCGLGSIEYFGRMSPRDASDLIGVVAILALLRGIFLVPFEYAPWRSRLCQQVLEALGSAKRALRHQIGIDLRGDSRVPARSVPLFRWVNLAAWGTMLVCYLLRHRLPVLLRDTLLPVSAVAYFTVLGLLWLCLVTGIILSLVPVFIVYHDMVIHLGGASRRLRRTITFALTGGSAVVLLLCGWLLGPLPALLTLFAALLLSRLHPQVGGAAHLSALVRNHRGDLYSMPLAGFFRDVNSWTCLLLLVIGMMAGGGNPATAERTAVTQALGTAFLWLVALAFTMVLAKGLFLFLERSHLGGSAAARLKTAWLVGNSTGPEWRQHASVATERLRKCGWRLVNSHRIPDAESADLVLRLGSESEARDSQQDRKRSPLPPVIEVDARQLASPDLPRRLDRLDHVWKRRRLYRALRRLFKIAASRSFQNGSGFLFAPHYWFVNGLTRDQDEDGLNFQDPSEGTIGPSYREILGVRLRRYLREIFDAVQLDLIYIEDGVGYRGLKRVLSILFEIYDIHGGTLRAEEHHFTGIPGLAVHIDEFGLDRERPSLNGYPEPDYEGIGRARVLVIHKRRGGDDDTPDPSPDPGIEEEDWSWLRDELNALTPTLIH